ncbi:hypothetical protein JTE90_022569 [Oedothorax gibbosus]|uniref:Uncharacterized protein n=1 Tax=Oedothorax gibbosus TaxID=931172 RepID=A0AAV6TQL1_9ARAC|nr:hypothetical protein JTE90_022569 [Oedothorax gibbosus]
MVYSLRIWLLPYGPPRICSTGAQMDWLVACPNKKEDPRPECTPKKKELIEKLLRQSVKGETSDEVEIGSRTKKIFAHVAAISTSESKEQNSQMGNFTVQLCRAVQLKVSQKRDMKQPLWNHSLKIAKPGNSALYLGSYNSR